MVIVDLQISNFNTNSAFWFDDREASLLIINIQQHQRLDIGPLQSTLLILKSLIRIQDILVQI